jgi:tRNA(fMet)-specific endonuclease VapC
VVVLETNHLRELALKTRFGIQLQRRVESLPDEVVTTVVCAEEMQRGWLARIAAARRSEEQALAYGQFAESLHFLAKFVLLPWDLDAAARLKRFRQQGIRIGTMDPKIACITMEYDATLLTRNTTDFAQVPGLQFENWLD